MGLTTATQWMFLEIGNPTVNDDESANFERGNFWFNSVSGDRFWAKSVATGAAIWSKLVFEDENARFAQLAFTNGFIGNVTIPGSYPYNILGTDFCILASSAAANQVNLPAMPATGQYFIIKDSTGNALVNNITVSGNGNNIDGSGSQVINSNYGSFIVIYNGTEWNII